jgi:hypothetical protein
VQQTGFSYDNDLARRRFSAKSHHLFGGTNFIGQHAHGVRAFRMCHDWRIRILFANAVNAARRELDVHVTIPLPQIHFASRPFHHPGAEILVRNKKNVSIGRRSTDDLVCIAAGADHVGQRLHSGAAVDVGDDVVVLIGVLLQKRRELFRRTRFRKRTSRVEIWQNHALAWINDLRRFSHEMDTAKQDHVGLRFRRLITQA